MKQLLLLFSLFAASTFFAQVNSRAGHDAGIMNVSNIVNIHSRCYYVDNGRQDCCGGQARINCLNSTGNLVFKDTIPSGWMWNIPRKLIRTLDNRLLLLEYHFYSCDVGPEAYRIVKLDTNGAVLFSQFVYVSSTQSSQNYASVKDIAQHPDSSFYMILSGADGLVHYSKTGQFLSYTSTGISPQNSILALSNGHLLINTNGMNTEITTSNSQISQQISAGVSKFVESASGFIYGLTSAGSLVKYTASLTATASITPTTLAIADLAERHDSLFITGTNTVSNTPFFMMLDQNLAVLSQGTSVYTHIRPAGLALNGQNAAVCAIASSTTGTFMTFDCTFQFPVSAPAFQPTGDVGVIRTSVISSTFSPGPPYQGTAPIMPEYNLKVTVKNFGSSPVHSFWLNNTGWYDECTYFHKLYNMTILPGDTTVVQTGSFFGPAFTVPVPSQAGAVYHTQICMFTTVPDSLVDMKIDNDVHCDSIPATGIVVAGIRENKVNSIDIALWPNSFSDQLHIVSDVEINRTEVYNIVGTLQQQLDLKGKEAIVNTVRLPAGIYFIKIDTEKGSIVQKVIRQ